MDSGKRGDEGSLRVSENQFRERTPPIADRTPWFVRSQRKSSYTYLNNNDLNKSAALLFGRTRGELYCYRVRRPALRASPLERSPAFLR